MPLEVPRATVPAAEEVTEPVVHERGAASAAIAEKEVNIATGIRTLVQNLGIPATAVAPFTLAVLKFRSSVGG